MLTLLKAAKAAAKAAHESFFGTLYEQNAYRRGRWLADADSPEQCYLRAIALGHDVPRALRIVEAWRLAQNMNMPLLFARFYDGGMRPLKVRPYPDGVTPAPPGSAVPPKAAR